MRRILFAVLVLCLSAQAQLWSGIVDPLRAIDWSNAGVSGGIPSGTWSNCVTAACNTLFTGTVSIANINAAITSAPANTVVRIRAGTFSVSGAITFKSNVAVRGAGANQTRLNFTGSGGCAGGLGCIVDMEGTWSDLTGTLANLSHPAANTKTFSGTNGASGVYTRGATVLNLSGVTGSPNLAVGENLYIYQNDETTPQSNVPFICQSQGGNCSREGGTALGLFQVVRVTAINGNAVTVFPGLYAPLWATAKTPTAFWWGGTLRNAGLEDLTLNAGGIANFSNIFMWQANDLWLKGIGSIETGARNHVFFFLARGMTVQDSWFENSCVGGCGGGAATGYGLESWWASDILRQNNILNNNQATWVFSVGGEGIVDSYNFDNNGGGSVTAMTFHEQGNIYNLAEGNNTNIYRADTYHGTQPLQTAFRNRISTNGEGSIDLWSYNRYYNIIGNVLGGTSTSVYECLSPNASGSCSRFNEMIYRLGFAGENAGGGPEVGVSADNTVWSSIMRWGNYDTVNDANRFVSSEVPTGDPTLPNAVPANNNLPASFYLAVKPNWWPAAKAWPPIGPDVTGGNITGLNGRAYTIPSQDCYTASSGLITNFNAATCYPLSGGGTPAPPAAFGGAIFAGNRVPRGKQ